VYIESHDNLDVQERNAPKHTNLARIEDQNPESIKQFNVMLDKIYTSPQGPSKRVGINFIALG
jgi:hypothetical protein